MGVIATAVKHLLAAGVTGDDLVSAIAEMEAAIVPVQVESPRSKGAIRQQRYRENQSHKASQSVTSDDDVTESVTTVTNTPLPLSSPRTPQQTPTPAKTNPARVRGTRLTESWKPEPLTGEAGKIAALRGSEWVGLELVKFRNHWMAKSGQAACKADWQRTWANWIIQANEWRPGQQPRAGPARQQSDFEALMKQGERYRATAA